MDIISACANTTRPHSREYMIKKRTKERNAKSGIACNTPAAANTHAPEHRLIRLLI